MRARLLTSVSILFLGAFVVEINAEAPKCVKDSTVSCEKTTANCSGKGTKSAGYEVQNKNTATQKSVVAIPKKTILFFMNPNGQPCQIQDAILKEIKDSLAAFATVKYIKTTDDASRNEFSAYGIRGLPTLVIANPAGKEISRFTPGIQSKETILNMLRSSK